MTTKMIGERMAKIETSLQFIKDNIKDNQAHQDLHNNRVIEGLKHLEAKFDKKFANKWVEKFFIWAGGIMGAVALTAFTVWIISGGLK